MELMNLGVKSNARKDRELLFVVRLECERRQEGGKGKTFARFRNSKPNTNCLRRDISFLRN